MQHKESGNQKENKVRVLLVVRWPVGGIRTFHKYVYNNFSPDQYSLTLIAPAIDEARLLLADLEKFHPVFIQTSSNPTVIELGRIVFKTLRQGDFSIVHAHGVKSGLASIIGSKINNIPLLLTLHDIFSKSLFAGLTGKAKRIILYLLWYTVAAVHCVSYDCEKNLYATFPLVKKMKQKVFTIPHGIDTQNFLGADPVDLRQRLSITEQAKPVFLIGFFGRFMAPKGFRYLVQALEIIIQEQRSLPVKPLILTFGTGGFFREEKSMLKKKGLIPYFRFLPFESNIASVLKGLDLVVMPSLWEACGLLAMETLVAGVPLVASDCIGLKEVLQDTPAAMVPSRDSKKLADAIVERIKNPAKVIAINFQQDAARRFDVRPKAVELEKIYGKILHKNNKVCNYTI